MNTEGVNLRMSYLILGLQSYLRFEGVWGGCQEGPVIPEEALGGVG